MKDIIFPTGTLFVSNGDERPQGWILVLLSLVVGCGGGYEPYPFPDGPGAADARPEEKHKALPVWRERELGVMGTGLEIKVRGDDPAVLDRALEAAITEIRRVEDLMTDWRPSELTSLNESAGKGWHVVPRELAAIISRGQEMGKLTGGAFDISYAGAGRLWDFKKDPPVIPDAEKIEAALAHVGYARIEIDPARSAVRLPAGMRIGLGGIAKGYGVDRAMEVLREHGIEHAIVNAGGDMKILGLKDGERWELAVKHPRDRERAMAVLRLTNTCLVTSGDYERFFERDGKRYHHIIDPRTGYPTTGCLSASVVAPNAEFADALATAMCVLGPDAGLEVIEKLPRVEAIVVGMDGEVHVSTGLEGVLR